MWNNFMASLTKKRLGYHGYIYMSFTQNAEHFNVSFLFINIFSL